MPWLFSYGTLQDPRVQQTLFGRTFAAVSAALPGFRRGRVPVAPGDTLNAHLSFYEDAVYTGRAGDVVAGTVLEVTADELIRADGYESPAGYARVEVALASGDRAWVYVHRPGVTP